MEEEGSVSNQLLRERKRSQEEKDNAEIKHVLTGERFTDHSEIALLKVMNPIYTSMFIFGILWKNKSNLFRGRRCSFDFCTVHCCLVLFLVWFNFVRYFAHYRETDRYGTDLFRKICFHLVYLQFACGISTNVYFKHKYIPNFIKLWENYKIKHGGMSLAEMKRNILVRTVAINTVILVLSITFYAYGLMAESSVLSEYYVPLLIRFNIQIPYWLIVLSAMLQLYVTLAWLQSLIYCLCMNKNLKEEFNHLTTQFSEEMKDKQRTTTMSVKQPSTSYSRSIQPNTTINGQNQTEHYRQRHLELCKLVSTFDDVISSYLLSIYLFSIPAIVFFAYTLWGSDSQEHKDSQMLFLIGILCLTYYILILVSVTSSSSALSGAAQSMKNVLYSLDTTVCSAEEVSSLQIFLQKIANDHIGLTIWKFLNVDKRMLITMFTVIITYLTVLLKFAFALGKTNVDERISVDDCPCLNATQQVGP